MCREFRRLSQSLAPTTVRLTARQPKLVFAKFAEATSLGGPQQLVLGP